MVCIVCTASHPSIPTRRTRARLLLQVRSDLRLCGVYVCAPDILMLLSDNFDYQSVASDLVPGILSEQELGSTLHIHELARVSGGGPKVGHQIMLLRLNLLAGRRQGSMARPEL